MTVQVRTSSPSAPSQGSVTPHGERVLLVHRDPHDTLDQLASHLACQYPLTQVEDFLQALGDIGKHGQPAQVIGSLEPLADDLEPTIAALKRLAPGTKLVLIGRPDSHALQNRALQAGADVCALEPVNLEAITAQISLPNPSTIVRPIDAGGGKGPYENFYTLVSCPTHVPSTQTVDKDTPVVPQNRGGAWMAESGSWKPSFKPEALAAQVGQSLLQELGRSPTVGSAQAIPQPDDQELGDIDLVEHLLTHRKGITPLLLRIAATRSGRSDAQWALAAGHDPASVQTQVPPGRIRCQVHWKGRFLGILHALPQVDESTLRSWADWMSRWLAMEAQLGDLWDLALRDELTGAWNRRYFHRFLETLLQRAVTDRFQVTVMVFDIDEFKQYNDRFGHAAGDDILREAARLMRSVVRSHDVVARIGGDEFAVIFWDAQGPRRPHSQHPDDVRQAAQRFQKAILDCRFPRLLNQAHGTLTISGGLAGFPWDGRSPTELLERADAMCLESKRQGKNVLTFGPGACRTSEGIQFISPPQEGVSPPDIPALGPDRGA